MTTPGAPDFTRLPDLASRRLGGEVIWVSDEFFAPAENLLDPKAPVWQEDRYTDEGKWMDGWESRRRRDGGECDRVILRLGIPGRIHGAVVDTAHFRGNYPPFCSLEGLHLPEGATGEAGEAEALTRDDAPWRELLPRAPLQGDTAHAFALDEPSPVLTHVRFSIYPDGGVARLRLHGCPEPDRALIEAHARLGEPLDLASLVHGGRVVAVSDAFFSRPENLLLPDEPRGMFDGWETRRRRDQGHDSVVLRLGAPGRVRSLEIDTRFFRGNAPGAVAVEGCGEDPLPEEPAWRPLLPRTPVEPDRQHRFEGEELEGTGEAVRHVRVHLFPDGGLARVQVWAVPEVGA